MSAPMLRPRGEFAPGRGRVWVHPSLTPLMNVVEELFAHQTEPKGISVNPACERILRRQAAAHLDRIRREDPCPTNREVAGLRQEWLLTDDETKADELTRLVADAFIEQPPGGADCVFDIGWLCNEAALQRRAPRREGRRYAGWILDADPRGDETIALLPSIEEVNRRLPPPIRPEAPPILGRAIPPLCYHAFHTVRLAGEAARGEHVATFHPEDQGTPPKGRKWTAFYTDHNRRRFQYVTLPLSARWAAPAEVAPLQAKNDAEQERAVASITGGHELGHFSGPAPLRLAGYPGLEGFIYPILEELRADATWLFTSGYASRLLPDEAAWRDHQRFFWAEALRYISRGLTRRADSISALLSLNYLRGRGAIRIDADRRLSLDFERLRRGIADLVVCATQLIQAGDGPAAAAFCADLNYDLPNRRLKRLDPFVESLFDSVPC